MQYYIYANFLAWPTGSKTLHKVHLCRQVHVIAVTSQTISVMSRVSQNHVTVTVAFARLPSLQHSITFLFRSRQWRATAYCSDNFLTKCLKEILTLSDQWPIYLIIDAVDECPNTSGIPSLAKWFFSLWRISSIFVFRIYIYVSQAGRKSTYEASLTLSLLIRCRFITKADKRRISGTMFGLLSTQRTRSRWWEGGGRRTKIS